MEFIDNRAPPPISAYEEKFYNFLLESYKDEMILILKEPDDMKHYSLEIFFISLPNTLAEKILCEPDRTFPMIQKAALRAFTDVYLAVQDAFSVIFKRYIHVRFLSMFEYTSSYRTEFPGSEDCGQFFALVGTVVRATQPKVLEFKKSFKCSKCKNVMEVKSIASRMHIFPRVDKCPTLCLNAKMEPFDVGDSSRADRIRDYQEIKLQEQISNREGFGNVPKAITVILEDDLVDSCKPGDDVVITGTLFLRWKQFRKDQPISSEISFHANHVVVKNDQRASVQICHEAVRQFKNYWSQYEGNPFDGRNGIVRSIAPHVYGMYLIKIAVCAVLAGGVSKQKGGAKTRGESHLLLVGDPGTGKSQILKYISKITPRSVFTTGAGTTTAGLTVAAVRDSGEWHLEAGALVLADEGVCCIDEFSCIKEHDRVSIHEAMEQQSISVAKAGIVCKLSTKCCVVAATNPKLLKYDPGESLEVNIGLASPLLSRFDLIITLKDAENDAWDELLSDFILQDVDIFDFHAKNALKAGLIWDSDTIQAYFVAIKDKNPEMTSEAYVVLSEYFKLQRRNESRNASRTTVRLLESLTRLAEGHARLMYRDVVTIHDAITAVTLVEASMQSAAIANIPNTMHISFPEDPIKEYYSQAETLLPKLLLFDLWEREKNYLDNLIANLNARNNNSSMPPPPPPSRTTTQTPNTSGVHPHVINDTHHKSQGSNPHDHRPLHTSSILSPANPKACSQFNQENNTDYRQGRTNEQNKFHNSSSLARAQKGNHTEANAVHEIESCDSPELFPDESGFPKESNNPYTSTQNENIDQHAASFGANFAQPDEEDPDKIEILSAIPLIDEDDIACNPHAFRTAVPTPTRDSKNKRSSSSTDEVKSQERSKRKRDAVDTAEAIKSNHVNSKSLSSQLSQRSVGGLSQSNNSRTNPSVPPTKKYSFIERFKRAPRTQE